MHDPRRTVDGLTKHRTLDESLQQVARLPDHLARRLGRAFVRALRHLVAKRFVARRALVGHHAGVNASVHQIGDALPEAFLCNTTNMKKLCIESCTSISGGNLTARLALERLLAAVDALVVVQRRQFFEGATAGAADVRFVVVVVEQMLVVRLLKGERFAAQVAGVRHFTCGKNLRQCFTPFLYTKLMY